MSTRYLSRSDLRALLLESRDPLAERAAEALDPTEAEMLPIHAGGLDRRTYEVRLARSEAAQGPRTEGLRTFVEALVRPMMQPECVGFGGNGGADFVVLLDDGRVVAITAVEPREG